MQLAVHLLTVGAPTAWVEVYMYTSSYTMYRELQPLAVVGPLRLIISALAHADLGTERRNVACSPQFASKGQ